MMLAKLIGLLTPIIGLLWLDSPARLTTKEALAQLQPLIGLWKATGSVDGTPEQKQAGLWSEAHQWDWDLREPNNPSLRWTIRDGKHYREGQLCFRVEPQDVQLTLVRVDGAKQTFRGLFSLGSQKQQLLTLEASEPDSNGFTERLTFTLLHENRYLLRSDRRAEGSKFYTKQYQLGVTKAGEPFAKLPQEAECIVSGGRGTIAVSHAGKTYYVCCSGCKDAFYDSPDTWIAAANQVKK